MKAIVYRHYGSPDVLGCEEVETPTVAGDEVLIRVRAASVNPLDWHFMRGTPYLGRIMMGLRKPRVQRVGVDVAGRVEAVGSSVTRFEPGDEVFGVCRGAFAEYACASESALVTKPGRVTFEHAASVPVAGCTALQALRDKGRIAEGAEGLDQRSGGRRGDLRGADRPVVRSPCHRGMQYAQRGDGPIDWRRPGRGLREGGLHQDEPALRPDSRQRGEPFVVRVPADLESPRDIRPDRRQGSVDRSVRSCDRSEGAFLVRRVRTW